MMLCKRLNTVIFCVCFGLLIGLISSAPQVPDGQTPEEANKSCNVNGRLYKVGDTWPDNSDPCVQNKCMNGSLIETTRLGCVYKGVCKPLSQPWTEGCFTFTCEPGNNKSYTLTQAGCQLEDTRCLNVGERETQMCVVTECQIRDGAATATVIKQSCHTKTGCKTIGTYWHDGCTVYTCALTNGSATIQPLPHDRMRWPEGQYALLRPKTGCPDDTEHFWSMGVRKHFGGGKNSISTTHGLSGIYAEEFFTHEFCVRQLKTDSLPGYTTVWEAGSYCIFRSRGKCPKNFSQGFLMLDDVRPKSSFQRGVLPDGDYDTNTGFFFCCRDDGNVTQSIELPTENPLVLFQNNKAGCQSIKGMSGSIQKMTFSGAAGPEHFTNGTTPHMLVAQGNVTLSLCYYEPTIDCGCVDESGETIEANTEKTIGCVVKRCTSAHGQKIVDILEGGCMLNGSCVPEGHKWSELRNETCTNRACMRMTSGNDVIFEIVNITEGCSYGNVCVAVGMNTTDNCVTSVCELGGNAEVPAFKTTTADCIWERECKPHNSTWMDGCTTMRCNVTSVDGIYRRQVIPEEYGCDDGSGNCYKVGENVTNKCYDAVCKIAANKTVVYLDIVKGGCRWMDECKLVNETWTYGCHGYKCEWVYTESGFTSTVNATNVSCKWNNQCYREDEIWSDGCIEYKCVVSRLHNEVSWMVETHKLGCTDFNGQCVSIGHNITEKCVTYQCSQRDRRVGMEPVTAGCMFDNRCIEEDDIYEDKERCVNYICKKIVRSTGSMMQVSVAEYKCAFNNTCKSENVTWEDGCRTRKCVILMTDQSVQRSTHPVQAGCDDSGMCRPVGYTRMTDSCMKYECKFKQEYRDAFFTLVGGACKSGSGECKPLNSTWEEKTSSVCATYRCVKENMGYIGKVEEQSCMDSTGKCQPVGSSKFSALVNGVLRKQCECLEPNPSKQGVTMRCGS